jgi:hypothetical protein
MLLVRFRDWPPSYDCWIDVASLMKDLGDDFAEVARHVVGVVPRRTPEAQPRSHGRRPGALHTQHDAPGGAAAYHSLAELSSRSARGTRREHRTAYGALRRTRTECPLVHASAHVVHRLLGCY